MKQQKPVALLYNIHEQKYAFAYQYDFCFQVLTKW